MPKVTVVMPVRNGGPYLRGAIESVLAQSLRDFEFLIIDDASEDGSRDIVAQFGDPRIRLLRNATRLRLAETLNRGLDAAQGEHIARMDADDLCDPDRLSRQTQFLDAQREIGLCGTWARTFGDERRVLRPPLHDEDIRAYALFDNPLVHATVMMRREWLVRHGLRYDGGFYPTEDFEFWQRTLACFPHANLPQVLLRYRVHGGGMTGAEWGDMDTQACRVVRRALERLGLTPCEEDVRFHRAVARGRSSGCRTWAELDRAERWLAGIVEANGRARVYAAGALAQAVADAWFRACVHSAHLGPPLWARHRRSPLTARASRIRYQFQLALVLVRAAVRTRELS